MDDSLEQAKKKTHECQMALTDELDAYTLSRFRPTTSGLGGRFLATNRKAFHRKQMRLIVNDYFNKEEGDEPTLPMSEQAAFPSQTLARTLAEYREMLKKTEDCKAALIYELETYIQSRSSTTGRSARLYANLQSFHREQMLLIIDEFFNSEEDDLPTFQSTTVDSVNQVNVASNQESAQVDATPANQSISPVTPSDQQKLANSSEVQVMEEPNDEDSCTRPREVDHSITIENIVIVSTTEEVQSDCEADSDWACNDFLADKRRVQADSVMISPECDHSDAPPDDAYVELSTAGHVSESVSQMPTYVQQQASVPTNNEQVDNSVNNNFENHNVLQAMDFNDDDGFDSQALFDEAFVDEPFPTVDLVSLPSTSSGRRSTRSKNIVNYANAEEDSLDEYSTVNRNGKRTIPRAGKLSTHKRVVVEPVVVDEMEEEDDENEAEDVGVESVRFSFIVHHLNCPEAGCTEEFPDKAQLNGHLLSKHQIMEFQCKVKDCALSFATKTGMTDHHKLGHRNLKDWPCALCESTSKSYKRLRDHFGRYHEEGEFHCSEDKCDFTGKIRGEVVNHQYKHKPRKYECSFADCTASFKQKPHFTRHLRMHAQEKPFACEECHKAFPTKWELILHRRVHSDLKPYICKWPGCDYSASRRSNVNTHVRTVHFGLPASKKEQAARRIIDTRNAGDFIEKMPIN